MHTVLVTYHYFFLLTKDPCFVCKCLSAFVSLALFFQSLTTQPGKKVCVQPCEASCIVSFILYFLGGCDCEKKWQIQHSAVLAIG